MLVFTDTFIKVGIKDMVFHDAVMKLKKTHPFNSSFVNKINKLFAYFPAQKAIS